MKMTLKSSQLKNLQRVKHLKTIIGKKTHVSEEEFSNLEFEELNDFHKILQICEFILEKHEDKKTLAKNLKKYIKIIDSTLIDLESLDDEINQLNISANFSLNKIQEFESNLIKSEDFSPKHHIKNPIY